MHHINAYKYIYTYISIHVHIHIHIYIHIYINVHIEPDFDNMAGLTVGRPRVFAAVEHLLT